MSREPNRWERDRGPWFAAAHRGVETCAEPGTCGEVAAVDVACAEERTVKPPRGLKAPPAPTVVVTNLGFCDRHASARLGL